jgi:DNA-binding transcriptional MerR regulator
MNNQGTMRIGEVHAILRRDVPDIELSKIRYYEDKGLVQPTRSRKGYRLYSQRDVDCLREAIRLAHEEFVPLRVVRLRLIEQGLLDDVPVAAESRQVARATSNVISVPVPVNGSGDQAVEIDEIPSVAGATDDEFHVETGARPSNGDENSHTVVAPPDVPESSSPVLAQVTPPTPTPALARAPEQVAMSPASVAERESRASKLPGSADKRFDEWEDDDRFYSHSEFLAVSGLEAHVMNQLVSSGLLSPTIVANQSTFNERDLRVAKAVKELLARNVDIRLLGSLRRNVEREIGLLNDITQPVRPSKKALGAREARDHAKSVALEVAALRAELFARALHQYLGR